MSTQDIALLEALASSEWERRSVAHAELGTLMSSLPEGEVTSRAHALATRALSYASEDLRGTICAHVLPVLVRGGRELPPELDSLVVLASLYEQRVSAILDALPPTRRAAIFEREIARSSPAEVERIAGRHLDKHPDATRTVLDYFQRLGRLREGLNAVAWFREREAGVRSIADAYEAALGPPPYSFVDPVVVRVADAADLAGVQLEQWRYAASSYCGARVRDAAAFVKRLKKDELDEGDGEMRRWKILRGKDHVFDLWVVWVENGVFFVANTTEARVHIVQDTYEAVDKLAATPSLAADLAASAPESLWTKPAAKTRRKRAKAPVKRAARSTKPAAAKAPRKRAQSPVKRARAKQSKRR